MTTIKNIKVNAPIQSDINNRIASAWCAIAGKFTSAIAGHRVSASVSSNSYAPAWSDESSISFSRTHLPNLSDNSGLLVLKGLTWHELAHIKYTPRKGSRFITEITNRGLFRTFNMLEDARIEMLLTKRYSTDISDWLVGVVYKYLLENPDTLKSAFPLIHGRKYLPADIRSNIRQVYEHQDIADELGNLIDEFIGISFPRDTDRAIEIVQRVADLLPASQQGGCPTTITHGEGGVSSPYNPDPDVPMDDTDDLADDIADDVADDANGGAPTQTKSPSDTSSDDDADDTDVESESGSADDDSSSDESSDDESDDESDNGGGSGDSGSDDWATDALGDILADALNDVLDSLSNDIHDIREQIIEQDGGLAPDSIGDLRNARYKDVPVASQAIDGARDFALEMEQLRLRHDPAWEYEVDSGRINVPRVVIQGCEPDRAFDVFQDGRDDATDIESVVCLDISGSMSGVITDAYRAMYQIKAGIDTLRDAKCSVLTYNHQAQLLYGADEPAGSTVRDAGCDGGTDGTVVVRHATNILANSDKAVKIMFIICDGDLGGIEPYITKLRQAGVFTVVGWIGGYGTLDTLPTYNCDVVAMANTPTDLVAIARRVVNLAVERKVAHA